MRINELLTILYENKDKYLRVENDLIILCKCMTSYRGSYEFLAIEYEAQTYKRYDSDKYVRTVTDLIELLEKHKNWTMTGWKGGEYDVDFELPLVVANDGISTQRIIESVHIGSYYVDLKIGDFETWRDTSGYWESR